MKTSLNKKKNKRLLQERVHKNTKESLSQKKSHEIRYHNNTRYQAHPSNTSVATRRIALIRGGKHNPRCSNFSRLAHAPRILRSSSSLVSSNPPRGGRGSFLLFRGGWEEGHCFWSSYWRRMHGKREYSSYRSALFEVNMTQTQRVYLNINRRVCITRLMPDLFSGWKMMVFHYTLMMDFCDSRRLTRYRWIIHRQT